MTKEEMLKNIYEVVGEWTDAPLPTCKPLRIGDIIQRLNNNVSLCLDWEYDMSPSHEFIGVFLKRDSFGYGDTIDTQSDDCISHIYSLVKDN